MSRRPQQPPVEATQGELEEEEEEAISGVGEGDELMEDVQDQEEGYSTCFSTSLPSFSPQSYIIHLC